MAVAQTMGISMNLSFDFRSVTMGSVFHIPCSVSWLTSRALKKRQHGKLKTVHSLRLRLHGSGLLFSILYLLLTVTLALAQATDDKQSTFFMGRVKYSSNDGNDCGGVGQDLMRLVSRASTL